MTNLGDTASTEDQMQSGYSDDYISEKINRLPTNSTMGKQDTVSVLGLADGQCEAQSTLNVPLPAILTSETLSLAGMVIVWDIFNVIDSEYIYFFVMLYGW